MTSLGQFAQYLLKHDLKNSPARAALYNFSKYVMDPTLPFSPEVIQEFYSHALQFDNWRMDSANLSDTVRAEVNGFLKQTGLLENSEGWSKLRHSDTLQVVRLKVFQDLVDLVEEVHAPRRKSGDQIRITPVSETQVLIAILSPGGGLEVKVYPAMAIVCGPRLKLVAPVTHLFYSSDLELTPHVKQVLEGTLLTTHHFSLDFEGVHGLITRGYTFHKHETYIRGQMAELGDLFSSLKKIERHFINPQTDSYYQEVVGRLERANRLLSNPHPDNLEFAERALNKGRIMLKNVFPNDRLLTLLITHVEYGITQRRSQTSQNSPQQPEFRPQRGPAQ